MAAQEIVREFRKIRKDTFMRILRVICIIFVTELSMASDDIELSKTQYAINDYTEMVKSRKIVEAFSKMQRDLNERIKKLKNSDSLSSELPEVLTVRRGHPGILVMDIKAKIHDICFSFFNEIRSYFQESNVAGVYVRFFDPKVKSESNYELYLPVNPGLQSSLKNSVEYTDYYYSSLSNFIKISSDNEFVRHFVTTDIKQNFNKLKDYHQSRIALIDEILNLSATEDDQ